MKQKLRVLDTFAGIGGFSLGLERTGGFETVAFCEIEPFPQKVLKKHWPEVPLYDDIRELTADTLRRDGIEVDVITGGFPCQDISVAGKQAGIGEGTRSGLWSECTRLLSEIRPRYAIYENVANLLSGPSEQRGGWFGRILGDLAEVGYDAEWHCVPASALGSGHDRDRVWVVAYPAGEGRSGVLCSQLSKRKEQAKQWKTVALDSSRDFGARARGEIQGEPPLFLRNARIPNNVDGLKAAGNAVVPQIPELIGNAILEHEAARLERAA